MATTMISVNGTAIKCPSEYDITLNDVSASDAGRDETGTMYKGFIARKSTVKLTWNGVTPEDAYDILHAFSDHEYFSVTYYDPYYCRSADDRRTATFYRGDTDSPVWRWMDGNEHLEKVEFSIIEK